MDNVENTKVFSGYFSVVCMGRSTKMPGCYQGEKTRGNIIIGQSGGATAVINASLVGAFETALADERIDGICGMLYGIQGLLKEEIVDLRAEASHVWPQLLSTPSAALGTCRYKLQDDDPGRIIEILRRYNIRYLL